ncbi:MAG TPA: WD40 repeat domain-containing protein, partial [Pyrinomonadaceae bacterium]|nr:WD40 repeat domain-containing protein [Pyrinomonadaceae bacterium]
MPNFSRSLGLLLGLSLLAGSHIPFVASAAQGRRAGGRKTTAARPAAASASKTPAAPPRLVVQYGHERPIESAAFSRDGRYALTGSWDEGVAVLWDLEAGAEIRRFPDSERGGAQDGYMAVAISPDNRLVAASSESGVRVFDVATGRVVRHLEDAKMGSELILINLDFSDDGARLAAGTEVYEWRTGRVVGKAKPRTEHQKGEAATPDGRLVVESQRWPVKGPGGEETYVVEVKEAETGRVRARLGGHADVVRAVAISPDGRTAITGSDYGERAIRVWDAQTGAERLRLRSHTRPGTTSFAGGGLVNAFPDGGEVTLRDWGTGRETVLRLGEGERAGAAAVSPDGRRAVVIVGDETRVYDTETGRVVSRFPPPEKSITTRRDRPGFSPDGRFVVGVNCHSCAAALDEAETGRRLRTFKCNAGNPCFTAFSRDGRLVAVSNSPETGGAGHAQIISVADGRVLATTEMAADDYLEFNALDFSPDGRQIVTAGSDYTSLGGAQVKIRDAVTGKAVRELKGHELFIYAVEWSADGRLIATASADGTARLWDARTGAEVRRLEGHLAPVRDVRFSPDGKHVLTRGGDNAVRLYDTETGRVVAHMVNFENGDWVVTDSEGRFDSNNLESIRGLHWVAADDPLRPLPLEIFMRDYYEPRLLSRLLAGERFGPVRSLADLNR